MQLRIYDSNLDLQGITENQTSIVWTRKYYEPGNFTVKLPITDDNIKLYKLGNIVAKRGSVEAGVIEDVQLHDSYNEHTLTASGRFLSSYMDRRLIKPRFNFEGKIEDAMRELIEFVEPIPLVELGESQGFDDEIKFQATYKELLAYESKLAKQANVGYRFRPDFEKKKIVFEIYQGLDKTREQKERAFVEFSDKFDNLNNADARLNNQLFKNIVYIGGQGEGDERIVVEMGDDIKGLDRRELFVDARDMREEEVGEEPVMGEIPDPPNYSDYVVTRKAKDPDTGEEYEYTYVKQAYYTAYDNWLKERKRIIDEYNAAMAHYKSELARVRAEYIEALKTRGRQKLKECPFSDSLECDIIATGNFEYKKDYDLGDLVSVRKYDWDYFTNARLTEIAEVYEHEQFRVVPVLGTALPDTIDWEDK